MCSCVERYQNERRWRWNEWKCICNIQLFACVRVACSQLANHMLVLNVREIRCRSIVERKRPKPFQTDSCLSTGTMRVMCVAGFFFAPLLLLRCSWTTPAIWFTHIWLCWQLSVDSNVFRFTLCVHNEPIANHFSCIWYCCLRSFCLLESVHKRTKTETFCW